MFHLQHVFVKHGPYFVQRYGSLSVWSCQGLEFSHDAAKAAFHKHTQHGGGRIKKSPLLQTYEHWFRIIQHRFYNKELEASVIDTTDESNEARIQRRREASINSSAALHSAQWRARCQSKGSRWVPAEVNQATDEPTEATDAQRGTEVVNNDIEEPDTSSTMEIILFVKIMMLCIMR
jgi:hypothetical protein